MAWFWLSYADPERPQGEQFLGIAIVEGVNMRHATIVASLQGLNPGGECRLWQLPGELVGFTGRLLTVDEAFEANVALRALIAARLVPGSSTVQ